MKFDTQSLDSFHFYLNCFTVNESESIKNRRYNDINFYNRTKKIWTFCAQYFISYRKWILKWINFYFLTLFVIVDWVGQIITILSIVGFLFLAHCNVWIWYTFPIYVHLQKLKFAIARLYSQIFTLAKVTFTVALGFIKIEN